MTAPDHRNRARSRSDPAHRAAYHSHRGEVRDPRVLAALVKVPRNLFAPSRWSRASVPPAQAGHDASSSAPSPDLVALSLQALELVGSERVLDIGTGSGYQAALLGNLGGQVLSLELDPERAVAARRRIAELGLRNVTVVEGDGSRGWSDAAPYDAILVGGSVRRISNELINQLSESGRLVAPVGDAENQLLERVRRCGQVLESSTIAWCCLPALVGAEPDRLSLPWIEQPGRNPHESGADE